MKSRNKNYATLDIAFVSDAVYPFNVGGKEKRLYEVTRHLTAQGHKVTIYCMKWWKEKEVIKVYDGVTLYAICPYIPLYSGDRRSIRQAAIFALSTIKLLTKKFDVVDVDHMPHLVLFPMKLVSVLKRKKMIVTWNEMWGKEYWKNYLGKLGNIAYIIEYIATKLGDSNISISSYTTKKLFHEFLVSKSIITIPVGIDSVFIDHAVKSKDTVDVLFAGRLLKNKNVDLLVDAISHIKKNKPRIRCRIIGTGPEENRLLAKIKSLNLEKNIVITNFFKDHNELYSLMKSTKVFAFPSVREGFGIVVLEANACGLPVLVVDHKDNAAKELVKPGVTGFISKNAPKDYAKYLSQMLDMKWDHLKIKKITNKYDWQKLIAQYERIYYS